MQMENTDENLNQMHTEVCGNTASSNINWTIFYFNF